MEIMKIMEKLLNKISKYDIFVNYIPGCAIVFILKKVFDINLLIDNVALDLCLIYFYGIISKYIGTFLYKAIIIGNCDFFDVKSKLELLIIEQSINLYELFVIFDLKKPFK